MVPAGPVSGEGSPRGLQMSACSLRAHAASFFGVSMWRGKESEVSVFVFFFIRPPSCQIRVLP